MSGRRNPAEAAVAAAKASLIRSCGTLGRQGTDGQGNVIRLYTEAECNTTLKGSWSANGECIKRGGGSWSWDCGQLLKTAAPVSAAPVSAAPSGSRAPSGSMKGGRRKHRTRKMNHKKGSRKQRRGRA